MLAVYDLECNPPTYDVVAFLALAEIERKRLGDEYIDLHILPGPVGGFRRDSLWPRSIEERVALRENVLVPICHLLPSVRSVEVHSNRAYCFGGVFGYGQRKISFPAMMEAFKAGSRPLKPITHCVKEPRLITLTLREAEHHPLRNSQLEEWLAAYAELVQRGWTVVVIRDTIKVGAVLPGAVIESPNASLNLHVRSQFYQRAVLNVGISNGPMWMALFMDVPTLMLRPCEAGPSGYTAKYFERCGVPKNGQLPTSPPYQRLVWKDDTCENIVQAVEEMMCVTG